MTEKQLFIDAFAPGIFEFLKVSKTPGIDSYLKKKLKEAITQSLRKWSDRYPEMISVKAKAIAGSNDLFKKMWPERYVGGKTDGKSNLVFEHTTTIDELYKSLLTCKDLACVKDTLNSYSGVCWITRDEDNMLNIKKYKNKRNDSWEDCYKACSIEIIRKP